MPVCPFRKLGVLALTPTPAQGHTRSFRTLRRHVSKAVESRHFAPNLGYQAFSEPPHDGTGINRQHSPDAH